MLSDNLRRCTSCLCDKALSEFYLTKKGYQYDCKTCRKASSKEYRQAKPPELRREMARKWSANNPEKARANQQRYRIRKPEKMKARTERWRQANRQKVTLKFMLAAKKRLELMGGRLPKFKEVSEVWGDRCWYCASEARTVEHLQAVTTEGQSDISNLRPACVRCNSSKQDKPLSAWLAFLMLRVELLAVAGKFNRDYLHAVEVLVNKALQDYVPRKV